MNTWVIFNGFIVSLTIIAILWMLATSSRIHKSKLEMLNAIYISTDSENVSKIDNVKKSFTTYLLTLTINNGIENDGTKEIIKDVVISILIGVFATSFVAFILKRPAIVLIAPIIAIGIPLYARIEGKKVYKTQYVESFYSVINYIILYTSGGTNIMKAIEETEKLIENKDVIKPALLRVIATKNMSGVSTDSYMDSIKLLNQGINAPEINEFIRTISLQLERGTPLNETLYNQLHFIKQKQTLKNREKMSRVESKISFLKTPLCALPLLALLMIPPFLEVFKMF